MITNCVLLYAAFVSNFSIGITPDADQLKEITYCQNNLPANTLTYAPLIVKYFDEINIETAVKVIWCESRNKKNAYNYKANDSGLFQFIPKTWGWVKSKYNIPYWDYPINNEYSQFIPEYNIQAAALLVQEMHTRNNYWKPWNASKSCWGNNKTFENKWRTEES